MKAKIIICSALLLTACKGQASDGIVTEEEGIEACRKKFIETIGKPVQWYPLPMLEELEDTMEFTITGRLQKDKYSTGTNCIVLKRSVSDKDTSVDNVKSFYEYSFD